MIRCLEAVLPAGDALLEAAFRLRHSVFVDELGWQDLRRVDGREIDGFDGPHAIYFLAIEKGEVVGHLRMLPTTRPHLLSTIHPHLCQREYQRGPHVWEWTRACVCRAYRAGAPFGRTLAELTLGAMEWGLTNGVRDVVVEWHPVWVTRFLELGVDVKPLGMPIELDGQPIVAALLHYEEPALDRLRRLHGTPPGIVAPLVRTPPARTGTRCGTQ
jgi:acyl-homoserine lactone synthase